ncbi:MAG: envelope biogenesis factor ElyC, partial [Desulfuromonas sp.]
WAFTLLLRRKTRWLGVIVVLLMTLTLFAASYAPLVDRWLTPLEAQIPTYQLNPAINVDYVAVLGAGHWSSNELPLTSQVSAAGVIRLTEGIRIYRLNPGSKLIFTGFNGIHEDSKSYPEVLQELAVALGVPEDDILVCDGPRDTAEEARLIAENFSSGSLVLVTSAAHMPRALALFRSAGLDPTPAPTAHGSQPFTSWWVFPDATTLARVEAWTHEWIGYQWARLTGGFKPAEAAENSAAH